MTTVRNSSVTPNNKSDYITRNDPVNRLGGLVSTYLALPGIRFFAPMSGIGASGQAVDLILSNHLTNNANANFLYDDLVPYCRYNGSTQYHSLTDNSAHDILGSEAYVATSGRGLTIGMWVHPLSLPGTTTRLFSKGATTGNARSFALTQTGGNLFNFTVSGNGTNTFGATGTDVFTASSWYLIAGRFTPSTEVKLWIGNEDGLETFTNISSIPATLNNSAIGLAIGAQADGTQLSNIRASMCFLCTQAVSDAWIFSIFEQGRVLYGV